MRWHLKILILCCCGCIQQKTVAQQLHKLSEAELVARQLVSLEHAEAFATLQIQDFKGRIKPVHTLALDLLRKIYGKNSFKYAANGQESLTPTQVFLGMQWKADSWQLLPLIKVDSKTKESIAEIIPVSESGHAKPAQFFDFQGTYKLKDQVAAAYAKEEGKRNTLDKNIIKLDERLNIVWAIFNGQFLRIFPNMLDKDQKWFAPKEEVSFMEDDQLLYDKLIPTYFAQLQTGIATNEWTAANETVAMLKQFQQKNAPNLLLSEQKVTTEIWYNNAHIFFLCMICYSLIGLLLLVVSFLGIFYQKKWIKITTKIFLALVIAIATYHGAGIFMRWYISGHAPWSNGYEATIFISWIAVLAGLLFSKNTKFPAAATCLLAVCLMGIAHGNLMNPEITNLVPVLKSYWLMIHVAIITGSYGFLALGSLLALIVLVCMCCLSAERKQQILPKISELTKINHRTSIIGLYMLTIGTFLGGIWANESWGRYWGWDPKETWALISILVYAFVLHVQIMFQKNTLYLFNVLSLFALSSLIMTFFGVNYYLSGLHSYAAGDSFPIPKWIFVVIPILIGVCILANYKWKTHVLQTKKNKHIKIRVKQPAVRRLNKQLT